MSLVNDMLNDLEQRKAQQPSRQNDLEWLTAQAPADKKSRKLAYVAVALLLVIVALLAYRQFFSGAELAAENVVKAEPVAVVSAAAEQEQAVGKANVANEEAEQTAKPAGETDQETANLSNPPTVKSSAATLPDDHQAKPADTQVISASAAVVKTNPIAPARNSAQPAEKSLKSSAVVPAIQKAKSAPTKTAKVTAPLIKKREAPTLEQRDAAAYKAARRLLIDGANAEAENSLRAFLAANPNATRSNGLLLELLLGQGRMDEAGERLQSLQGLVEKNTDVRRLQAHYHVLAGEPEQAVKLLLSQQPELKSETQYYELLALAAQKAKQYAVAIKVYKSLLGFDAGQGDWWVGLAISEELYGLKANARANFLQATRAGRITPALRDYANQRHRALTGAVNVYPQQSEFETHGG